MKPTPKFVSGYPLLGNVLAFQKDRNALMRRGLEEIGPVFGLKLFNQNAAVLIGPEYHQVFFMETDKKLSMHKTYRFLRAMLGEVAFTAPPETYFKHRPVLHAPFRREKMLAYVEVMQEEIERWLAGLPDAGQMDLNAEIIRLVQRVAGHAFMGRDFINRFDQGFWALYGDLSKGMDPILPPDLPLPKFRRRDAARRKLIAMLTPYFQERRRNPDKFDDFLQDLINTPYKDGSPVEDDILINMILGLVFAGHETTAGQAAWTVIELARNPDYAAQVRQEAERLLPSGIPLTQELLNQLKYTEWAVREVERLHPSTDILIRMVEEEIEVGDYRIPPGWIVFVNAFTAQRLPSLFKDPERFDPLRFSPGREEDKQHRFALITFGGGMHKCVGMNFAYNEMMIIAALLLRDFDLELCTPEVRHDASLGASRPSRTLIQFHRRNPRPAAIFQAEN